MARIWSIRLTSLKSIISLPAFESKDAPSLSLSTANNEGLHDKGKKTTYKMNVIQNYSSITNRGSTKYTSQGTSEWVERHYDGMTQKFRLNGQLDHIKNYSSNNYRANQKEK